MKNLHLELKEALISPIFWGSLTGIISSLFNFKQSGILISVSMAAILLTIKTKRLFSVKELFIFSGSFALLSFLLSLALLFQASTLFESISLQFLRTSIWAFAQIFVCALLYFAISLITNGTLVLLDGNKLTRFICVLIDKIADFLVLLFIFLVLVFCFLKIYIL